MKNVLLAGLLTIVASTVMSKGLDRSGQGLGALFENGSYFHVSLSQVAPKVKGIDTSDGKTGDVMDTYFLPSLSIKFDIDDRISLAVVADQPYGADIRYGDDSSQLGGTMAKSTTNAILGLARYRVNQNVSLHGGLRVQNSAATVRLEGLAYGPISGYQVKLRPDTASGPVIGAAFDYPATALRVAVTYHAHIVHKLNTQETAPLAPLNGTSTTSITTPRAVNLDFQSGIAKDTLLFGQLRWVNWSEFRVDPERLMAVTGDGLVELEDARTWTLGIARQFSDRWRGALSLIYEPKGESLSSPLSPTNGKRGITLAVIHTQGQTRISVGISYTKLGDAKLETGTPDVQRATMTGSTALGFGIKVGHAF